MKIVIVSGYFNSLHIGHIKMFQAAQEMGEYVIVIVNNDKQQLLKKNKIIMTEQERLEIVKSIRYVDKVFLSIDEDRTVCESLAFVARYMTKGDDIVIFANGGDRDSKKEVPESPVCEEYDIQMVFDCGGIDKLNSSTNINKLRGEE
jgi:cytidyltransferase-like protein